MQNLNYLTRGETEKMQFKDYFLKVQITLTLRHLGMIDAE